MKRPAKRPDISKKVVGTRIRFLRESRQMTQRDLCNAAGLSVGFLSDIENGKRTVSIPKLAGIAWALVVSCDEIVFGDKRGKLWE